MSSGRPRTPPPAGAEAARGIAQLERVPPVVLVLTSITSIQFGAALAATVFDRAGPAGTSVLRLGFAALVLLAVWRPWRRRHPPGALRLAAAFGLVLGAMNLTFYAAIDRIPLGVAVTIEFLGPITVATLLSRRRLDLAWVALALLGVLLLTAPWRESTGLDALGVGLALAAAAFWGGYILIAQRAGRVFHAGEGLSIAVCWAALVPLVPGVAQAGADLLDPALLATGLGVGLLSSVIPYSLETEALRRIPTRVFGVLMSLEPAVAAGAGLIVLGQSLNAREAGAIALVVAASVGVTRTAGTTPDPAATLDA